LPRVLQAASGSEETVVEPRLADVTITHHWTGETVMLPAQRYSDAWLFGPERMQAALLVAWLLIRLGDVVFDVGGHIGYVAMYFGSLVGPEGRVFTFETNPEELPYLRQNIENARHRNIILVENTAVGVVTLDEFAKATGNAPDFVRIDAPGAEHCVLGGMRETLTRDRPRLMVAISGEFERVREELRRANYILLDERKQKLKGEPGSGASLIALAAEDEEGRAKLGIVA
jgi:hypothetical protein